MADLVIPCFVEDDAHRAFLHALMARISVDEGWAAGEVRAEFRSSTGGRGSARSALIRYLRDGRAGRVPVKPLLVVLLDGNCQGSGVVKRDLMKLAEANGIGHDSIVAGVPDPHVERWLLDGRAFKAAVDPKAAVEVPKYKCERARYKTCLRDAFKPAGIFPPAGGVEYAADLVPRLDLEKPACGDLALKDFADDLRGALRRLKGTLSR